MYTISHLKKIYGNKTVLNIPELEITGQQIYALLGPNGAGKTTLLNILGFLEEPSAGRIHYNNQPVRFAEKDLQELRRKVSLVDQFPILFTTSVYKNLEFGLKLRKVPEARRGQMIEAALDLVGMRAFSNSPAQLLSGGETQRVALARALVLSPQVLLCDEPTSSVDVEHQNLIINILRQMNEQEKITVLFTTHDKMQAVRLAHQTLVLDRGRFVKTGYENIFTATLHEEQSGTWCAINGSLTFLLSSGRLKGSKGKVRVIIDPEKIELSKTSKRAESAPEMKGRVVNVMEQNSHIRVVIDAGIWMTVLMSHEEYLMIAPQVGQPIGFHIPGDAVHILN